MITVFFPKIFLCTLQIITLLDPITWLLVSHLHTPILFYIHLYPIPYLCMWNNLSEEQVSAPSLQAFKKLL